MAKRRCRYQEKAAGAPRTPRTAPVWCVCCYRKLPMHSDDCPATGARGFSYEEYDRACRSCSGGEASHA